MCTGLRPAILWLPSPWVCPALPHDQIQGWLLAGHRLLACARASQQAASEVFQHLPGDRSPDVQPVGTVSALSLSALIKGSFPFVISLLGWLLRILCKQLHSHPVFTSLQKSLSLSWSSSTLENAAPGTGQGEHSLCSLLGS